MATNRQAIEQQSLSNAVNNQSLMNYATIIEGFISRGIPENEIRPRENVFTYNAWRALGRQVRKGEHGVKVVTFIVCEDKQASQKDGKQHNYRRPWSTTVFHISQTDAIPDATRDTQGESYADSAEPQAEN